MGGHRRPAGRPQSSERPAPNGEEVFRDGSGRCATRDVRPSEPRRRYESPSRRSVGAWYASRMKPARKHASYDDVLNAPETVVAELIEGDLYTSPRPAIPHARTVSALSQDLRSFDEPPGDPGQPDGWWIIYEPELHFGADVLVPDLAGWRRERLPSLPDAPAFTLAPDWVCEVLSRSTAPLDRARKMPIYARRGVTHLWLIDPQLRTLEVYRREDDHWRVVESHGGSSGVRAEPFAAVELDMRRWWGER